MDQAVPQTRWATTVDGLSIAYQDFGDGPLTLLVAHGWVSHLEVYWEQPRYARFMRRLARSMRVLVFDKRGVGMSDRAGLAADLETRMDDVRAVLDAAGVERAALLGWGTGGPMLAAFFAATHPERVLALCIDPSIHLRKDADWPFGPTEEEFERESGELVARWGHGTSGYDDPPTDPAFVAWDEKISRYAATPTSIAAFDRAWFETDVRGALATVQAPTLILAKERSGWANPEIAANVAARIPNAKAMTVEGNEGVVWVDDPEPLVGAIEGFLARIRDEEAELDRVLATVLFTDIVDSTSTAAVMGDAKWRDLLAEHDRMAKTIVGRYRGTYVKSTGDGAMATFDGPARAVRAAQALVEAVRPLGLEIRTGAHTGEVTRSDDDLAGLGVHVAARVAAMAGTGEVWASSTVKDLTAGSGLTFEDGGEHELKGVPDRWRLYRVIA
jgi:class 3 adenylate cyclase